MIDLEIKNVVTASDAAKTDLRQVQQKYPFFPNLMGLMPDTPPILIVAIASLTRGPDPQLMSTELPMPVVFIGNELSCVR